MKYLLILVLVAGCAATSGNDLTSGDAVMPPTSWLVYCYEHPAREECKP